MRKTEKQRMLEGALYLANDKELESDALQCRRLNEAYNQIPISRVHERRPILEELLGGIGSNVTLVPPVYFDYGCQTQIGDNFFSNSDLIILDVAPVTIGSNVMFGPRVSLYTAGHPIDPIVRNTGLEYGLPIVIEDSVWLGGNVVVNPGVTIGEGSVIGAGSVVTKDIPAGVIAAGVPCRVIRNITREDSAYWNEQRQHYLNQ